jgi:membrane protein YdbS with pleckstrin-like domain
MTKTKLHPGVKWQFRIGAYFAALFFIIFISIFLSSLLLAVFGTFGIGLMIVAIVIILVGFIVLAEVWVQMAYNRWMYEFTKEALKIEHGVIWKTYKSIPYERVQNVDIRRGILARILGFSTLEIQTAGYSGGYYGRRGGMPRSEGHIPAVSIKAAEKIRDFLMKKISGKKTKGGL